MYTRQDVMKAIQYIWPHSKYGDTFKILDEYGQEASEYERDRVQLAILKLSKGNKERLSELVNLAKIDYRDVLMSAEYSDDGEELKNPYIELGIKK